MNLIATAYKSDSGSTTNAALVPSLAEEAAVALAPVVDSPFLSSADVFVILLPRCTIIGKGLARVDKPYIDSLGAVSARDISVAVLAASTPLMPLAGTDGS